jgi:quinol-cytochrome oxidoreductase complex cytochrome b subunit
MATQPVSDQEKTIPFFPDHITTEFLVTVGIIVVVIIIGLIGFFSPVGLQDPADPMNTPDHVKPEWYFLALYQLLKYIPKTTGALVPVLLVLLILIWPFIDRKSDTKRAMLMRWVFVIAGSVLIIALTIWGEVS